MDPWAQDPDIEDLGIPLYNISLNFIHNTKNTMTKILTIVNTFIYQLRAYIMFKDLKIIDIGKTHFLKPESHVKKMPESQSRMTQVLL